MKDNDNLSELNDEMDYQEHEFAVLIFSNEESN